MGWKRVYSFLDKDEKTRRNLYLLLLKISLWKEVGHFSVQCILTETTLPPTQSKGDANNDFMPVLWLARDYITPFRETGCSIN